MAASAVLPARLSYAIGLGEKEKGRRLPGGPMDSIL
jgi:hypothetical protein